MATHIKKTNAAKSANDKSAEVKNITTKVETTPEKNSVIENEIQKLREENAEKTQALDDMTKQLSTMQELINKLLANQSSGSSDEGEVLVGCRFVNGAAMAPNDSRLKCEFACDEEKYVPVEDLKIYLKEAGRNLRTLFEIDGFYFVDQSNYDKFKIKKRIDLSHDKIKEILFAPTQHDMINRVNELTNNKKNFNVLHLFEYEICKMLIDPTTPLMGWDYANRTLLEDYIGIKFDELLARYSARCWAVENRN